MQRSIIAVIGAGTMGRGIARSALLHGFDVRVFDANPESAGRVAASAPLDGTPSDVAITAVGTISAAVDGAEAVIECVVESELIKAEVLRAIGAAASAETLLASNTSTFSIGALAANSGTEGRLIGMHFFNPAERMRLVEVAVVEGTSDEDVRRCTDLVEALGKAPVVVRDCPGFITSRLGLLLGNEAMRLIEAGAAEPQAIDTAMRLGYNHPMGPLELADLVGLDARLNNLKALYRALGDERYRPAQIIVDMVGAGHFGRKTGRGFYLYDENGRKREAAPPPVVAAGEPR